MAQTTRTKSILMLNYQDKRRRMNLEKKLQKKQIEAEKVQKNYRKEQANKLKKMLDRVDHIQQQKARDDKLDFRERLHQIQEIQEKDKNDFARITQMRDQINQERIKSLEKEKESRLRAQQKQTQEEKVLELGVPRRLQEHTAKMEKREELRTIFEKEKVQRVHERNNYLD